MFLNLIKLRSIYLLFGWYVSRQHNVLFASMCDIEFGLSHHAIAAIYKVKTLSRVPSNQIGKSKDRPNVRDVIHLLKLQYYN